MNTTVNSTARSTGKKKADAPRTLTLKPVHMRKLALPHLWQKKKRKIRCVP